MNTNEEDRSFETLLDYLRRSRGFDFTGYKRSSLKRRVNKRMHTVNINNFTDYLDYLEVYPEQFIPLFNTILINVTAFFRDKIAWDYLRHHTIPRVLDRKLLKEPIRVWSAGCASGQETYTVAMILAEALGLEKFRQRVKIYATDVDEEALFQARHASYSSEEIDSVPEELQLRYFEKFGDRYIFRSDLRRSVIFGRHDLVQDAPISRLDLLICRNTIMYFNAETQARILARFHFALNDIGALFLGKAEMLLTHANLFSPLNLQYRIFSRVPKVNLRDRLLMLAGSGDQEASKYLVNNINLQEIAFNTAPEAQIVVDFNGNLVMANLAACSMFGLSSLDLGRLLQDLEISYRPLELRSRIEQVYKEGCSVIVENVSYSLSAGNFKYLKVIFLPLQESGSDVLGVSIVFSDVTRYYQLQSELQRANQELETANEELQSSNEELETTNEELQSTNEELETTNEEMQSTNEELETMNEELQSTNEELQTINDELRLRTDELNQTNAFLNSILASLQAGVVVIDRNYNILSWNNQAYNLWGLRSEEVVQQSFFNLNMGLPVDQVRETINRSLSGEDHLEVIISATNRLGQAIECRITCDPLIDHNKTRQGAILMMEAVEPRA
ncbi:MAG: PAS domain S-box protein [Symploca sp. SIO1C4]|uniref:protein-glutamate O-methyltransferase n=1 Tax=Symploca sp. SIO1C4 TaxID=2607765 RepID=A0A6B3N1G4_9CYAN|nr:PAS domain S-box protein [Symploca sp. SIO1C4]